MSVNLITDWRVSLKAALKSSFPAARIYDGERPPSAIARDKDVICIFAPGITAWSADINNAQPAMTIRYWCAQPLNSVEVPADPAPVERAMMALAACLKPLVTALDGPDYFSVERIEADYSTNYGVEAILVGWTRSPLEQGG